MQLSFGADGNAGPLFCPNGALNTLAWNYFVQNGSVVMLLGPNATPSQVENALCHPGGFSTGPISVSTYQLAAAYYGWHFGIDPTSVLYGGCSGT